MRNAANPTGSTPLDALGVIGSQDVMITPRLRHAEFFTMRGLLTSVDPDTWKPGEEMPLKINMSLRYYKLEIDGAVVYEIDPVNYKAVINGVDQLETTRQHLAI